MTAPDIDELAGAAEGSPPLPAREQRRQVWDGYVRRFGLGPDRWRTPYGEITPWTTSEFHPDPARRMSFYTGVGHPHHLNDSPIPLFLSATTLARYRRRGEDFPIRMSAPWAGDSGAYAALMLGRNRDDHPWSMHPDDYGGMWVRLTEDVGPPNFVAVQDWPCEESVRRVTGMTVREHQELTTRSYLYLVEEFPMVPWLLILQGWEPWQYLEHAEMYQRHGIDLAGTHVGIGSVCRRGSQEGVAAVLRALAPLEMRMHGFGVSINALRVVGHLLASSDSQAWSVTARRERIRLPGCTHMSRPHPVTGARVPTDCRNCFRFAVTYREEALDAVRQAVVGAARAAPEPLFACGAATHLPAPAAPRAAARSRRPAPGPDQLALFDPTPQAIGT